MIEKDKEYICPMSVEEIDAFIEEIDKYFNKE